MTYLHTSVARKLETESSRVVVKPQVLTEARAFFLNRAKPRSWHLLEHFNFVQIESHAETVTVLYGVYLGTCGTMFLGITDGFPYIIG